MCACGCFCDCKCSPFSIALTVLSFRTPLMLAAANGFTDSVSLLISQGCNVLANDLFHRTALHGAVSLI